MSATTHSTCQRQLRLPGQVAAPDGPIDMRMMYVMHHAFRSDLDLFSAAVRNTPAAERGDLAADPPPVRPAARPDVPVRLSRWAAPGRRWVMHRLSSGNGG